MNQGQGDHLASRPQLKDAFLAGLREGMAPSRRAASNDAVRPSWSKHRIRRTAKIIGLIVLTLAGLFIGLLVYVGLTMTPEDWATLEKQNIEAERAAKVSKLEEAAQAEADRKKQFAAEVEARVVAAADRATHIAVRQCEKVTKRLVMNPTSFETVGYWDTKIQGSNLILRRNFRAMNGFGANLDNYYVCTFDFVNNQLVDIQFFDGNY